ncbi:hypothetical protein V2H45_03520 [Tumidithrix elongata RA019]|uniref:Uncharacterized protein n=1 Tax=Tumidithrix elongata BACA0141 TaxID=2716417 RepID=A0AAW9PZ99_9CYAN|nr:hypothetical protein [Tumidithrix elongata RA019]
MGGKWHIGKENPYVDVKNLCGKPENIQCFADGPDINKRLVGKRDSESASLNTVRIVAERKEGHISGGCLFGKSLLDESVCFVWEQTPQEIYRKQINDYKKSHSISPFWKIFACFFLIVIIGAAEIYCNNKKTSPPDTTAQTQVENAEIINKLNLEYQKLPLNQKIFFLQRTGLSKSSDSKSTFEKKSLKDFISRHFYKNKPLFDNPSQRTLFLKHLSNEIGLSIAQNF